MGTNWYALTERGREQARITGKWLRAQYPSPRRIIRSYYQRTRETADLLYPDFPIREDERLAEASRGIWHVRTEDEIRREAPWEIDRKQFEGLYHYRPIGGENWPDVEGRVRAFRQSLRCRYPGETVVAVTHGHLIMLWQKLVHGWTIEETVARYERHEFARNAAVLLYHGETRGEKHMLTHNPAEDYVVPWEGKIAA